MRRYRFLAATIMLSTAVGATAAAISAGGDVIIQNAPNVAPMWSMSSTLDTSVVPAELWIGVFDENSCVETGSLGGCSGEYGCLPDRVTCHLASAGAEKDYPNLLAVGWVEFDAPVLAVITDKAGLALWDPICAPPGVVYPDSYDDRGLESDDVVGIPSNTKVELEFNIPVYDSVPPDTLDQVRILTRCMPTVSPDPDPPFPPDPGDPPPMGG